MAATVGFSSNGPVPWTLSDTEVNNLYRDLELGTVLTLFYSKKSQRPERRTFQVKLETRQIIWTRGTDKIEGESKLRLAFGCLTQDWWMVNQCLALWVQKRVLGVVFACFITTVLVPTAISYLYLILFPFTVVDAVFIKGLFNET